MVESLCHTGPYCQRIARLSCDEEVDADKAIIFFDSNRTPRNSFGLVVQSGAEVPSSSRLLLQREATALWLFPQNGAALQQLEWDVPFHCLGSDCSSEVQVEVPRHLHRVGVVRNLRRHR